MSDLGLPPPAPNLRASVVVPAKDEEDLIGRCVQSLASQTGVTAEEYEVILVLDRCTDATADRALEAASDHPELRLALLEGPGLGAGYARRAGMEAACERLLSLGRPGALIASTDADTVVAPDWLYRQLQAAGEGARAIGGRIELLDEDGPSEEIRSWRDRRGETRHLELLERGEYPGSDSRIEHWQFSGASMSLTAEAYREVGGMEPRAALEDEHLENALDRCSIPIERPLDVRVSTSPRLVGRASRGLAKDLSLASWLKSNTYHGPPEPPATGRLTTVSVIAPSSEDEAAPASPELPGFDLDLIRIPVHGHEAPLAGEFGPVLGRGDALWRGLSEAKGDLVVLLPELSETSLAAVPALLAPLLCREDLELIKGYPSDTGVSELSRLVGIPLINLHHPELAGLVDPLSGFTAARRPLLESLAFPVGAGVDASLLLDAAHSRGVGAVAQAVLPPHSGSATFSTEDSHAIMSAFLSRTERGAAGPSSPAPLIAPYPVRGDFDSRRVRIEERPPLSSLDRSDRRLLQKEPDDENRPASLQSGSTKS
jgi:hypothetical protein